MSLFGGDERAGNLKRGAAHSRQEERSRDSELTVTTEYANGNRGVSRDWISVFGERERERGTRCRRGRI